MVCKHLAVLADENITVPNASHTSSAPFTETQADDHAALFCLATERNYLWAIGIDTLLHESCPTAIIIYRCTGGREERKARNRRLREYDEVGTFSGGFVYEAEVLFGRCCGIEEDGRDVACGHFDGGIRSHGWSRTLARILAKIKGLSKKQRE